MFSLLWSLSRDGRISSDLSNKQILFGKKNGQKKLVNLSFSGTFKNVYARFQNQRE